MSEMELPREFHEAISEKRGRNFGNGAYVGLRQPMARPGLRARVDKALVVALCGRGRGDGRQVFVDPFVRRGGVGKIFSVVHKLILREHAIEGIPHDAKRWRAQKWIGVHVSGRNMKIWAFES